MIGAAIVGAVGVSLVAISAWLHVKGKGGDGWAVVAFFLIIASCQKAMS